MATSVALPPRSTVVPRPAPKVRPQSAADHWNWRLEAPAWLVSMLVHLVILLLLGLGAASMKGTGAPMYATLVASSDDRRTEESYFDDERDAPVQLASASPSGGGETQAASDVFGDQSPVSSQGVLPAQIAAVPTLGNGPGDAIGTDEGMTDGTGQTNQVAGSKVKTYVFGVEGEGSKFVFVFDRSASMNEFGQTPIRAAKAELIAAISHLENVHQFQVIFYNEAPTVMRLASRKDGLVVGDDATKRLAERYINGIAATGGTNHFDALEVALGFRPDVIFFLTDADQPGMRAQELRQIKRGNGGVCSIHTIEFGRNEAPSQGNFLQQLAKENRGQYRYINISELRNGRRP